MLITLDSKQLKRGILQARLGSRASVGSEVIESHVQLLNRGSPSLALEDTSLSSVGKQRLQKSLHCHQPDALAIRDPTGFRVR